MPLLRLDHQKGAISCDGEWEFVQLLDDGTTKINEKQVRDSDLASLVSKIMERRAERVIYLIPSRGIPYSRLVETVGTLTNAVPDLHVGVLTGKLRDSYMRPDLGTHLELPCDIEWPAGEL